MLFVISDTFEHSLNRLPNVEQRRTKTTAFDMQMHLEGNGKKFHKLEKCIDPQFWSVRVNDDIRIIVHRDDQSLTLCYVDHHDAAYHWAENRIFSYKPDESATVNTTAPIGVSIPAPPQQNTPVTRETHLFDHVPTDYLRRYGVPEEYINTIKDIKTIEELYPILAKLTEDTSDILIDLSANIFPNFPDSNEDQDDLFEQPEVKRHFRVINNADELEQAFAAPWEKWIIFLHPQQQAIVDKEFNGPARVAGSAGTGKTVVALHRAVALAKKHHEEGARILLTTFSRPLANALQVRLNWLLLGTPRLGEQIELHSLKEYALNLYRNRLGKRTSIIRDNELDKIIKNAREEAIGEEKIMPNDFSEHFISEEWKEIVDAFLLKTWEDYRDFQRLGRKTRLPERKRKLLWGIFEKVYAALKEQGKITISEMFDEVTESLKKAPESPIDYAIVDEAQDIGAPELRFLAALGKNHPDSLFFAGDSGQRIFRTPFSWERQGVSIRGRSSTLKINYRTSHQIRKKVDWLLPDCITDIDGNVENRKGTISVFEGIAPLIELFDTEDSEINKVAQTIRDWQNLGIKPGQIGIFTRTTQEFNRAEKAVTNAKERFDILDDQMEPNSDCIAIGTMHQAKGLEFMGVIVMACDANIIPSEERIEAIVDEADLDEVNNTERYLLYVACTRAREHLLVCGVTPGSEFLSDLNDTTRNE